MYPLLTALSSDLQTKVLWANTVTSFSNFKFFCCIRIILFNTAVVIPPCLFSVDSLISLLFKSFGIKTSWQKNYSVGKISGVFMVLNKF